MTRIPQARPIAIVPRSIGRVAPFGVLTVITPTVGRIVWFWPGRVIPAGLTWIDTSKPLAAIVTHVYHSRHVNLTVFDSGGLSWPMGSVPLLQDDDHAPSYGYYAEWMPYQKSVASGTIAPTLHAQPV